MYRVFTSPGATRAVKRLQGTARMAIRGVLAGLALDPRPPHSRKVTGTDLLRIRVRIDRVPWRVVYRVSDQDPLVTVTRVVRRDEATYRGL